MNLEEQIAQEISEQQCSQIDFEILSDILVRACGWHRIELDRFSNNKQAIDIVTWCQEKTQGEWRRTGCKFIFKEQGDAVNFVMKWK